MIPDLNIEMEWLEGTEADPLDRSTYAEISINANGESISALEDLVARTTRSGVRASAYRAAYWFAENWWRLRWEPEFNTVDWRMTHFMASIGGGYAWPDIRFSSDGFHVLVEAYRTPGKQGAPVRYLGESSVQITSDKFETCIDDFIERVLARISSYEPTKNDLSLLWEDIKNERKDEQTYAERQLEALLGFDPDEAPKDLMSSLVEASKSAGRGAVNEVAAANKKDSIKKINDAMEYSKGSSVKMQLAHIQELQRKFRAHDNKNDLAWRRAEHAAQQLRRYCGLPEGPISNATLSDLLSIPQSTLETDRSTGPLLSAGFRSRKDKDTVSIVQRATRSTGRRFEVIRLVADHMFAPDDDSLLPITTAKTDRQKFQRAFAVEFLVPFEELRQELNCGPHDQAEVGDEEIEEIADVYSVSPLLIRTSLVNRGMLPREALLV